MHEFHGNRIIHLRRDGTGEMHDAGETRYLEAESVDHLRADCLERTIADAVERGQAIRVTVEDVDAVYDLKVHPTGAIDELARRPLPGPSEAASVADETFASAGVAPAESEHKMEPFAPELPGLLAEESESDAHQPKPAPAWLLEAEAEREADFLPATAGGSNGDAAEGQAAHAGYPAALHLSLRIPRVEMMSALNGVPEEDAAPPSDAVAESAHDAWRPDFLRETSDKTQQDRAGYAPSPDSVPAEEFTAEASNEFVVRPEPGAEFETSAEPKSVAELRAAAARESVDEQASAVDSAPEPARATPAPSASPASAPAPTAPRPLAEAAPILHPDEALELPAEPPMPKPRAAGKPPRRAKTLPTFKDFLGDAPTAGSRPAERGWRAGVRQLTGGLVRLAPGAAEQSERADLAAIQRGFSGSKTIVVVNPKGGAHKTTASLMIAATFGQLRGGYTLAWDNNETRGTLGWRAQPGSHSRTAVDLLRRLPHFEVSGGATIGDIDQFVRSQADATFDVLASDDDAASAAIIDDEAFSRLHRTLSRFYRLIVVDTGNNMRASNWEAALDVADQLVIVSTSREDTAASAAWLADGLRERGHEDMLRHAVTILSNPDAKTDANLTRRLEEHFAQLTRAVVEVPYDPAFVGGGQIDLAALSPKTRAAWRHAAAVIAEGL